MTEETIFTAALQRQDPAARQEFLDEVCGGDEALRRRVEALLHSHQGADRFLRKPALEQMAGPPEDPTRRQEDPGAAGPFLAVGGRGAGDEPGTVLGRLEPPRRPGALGRLKDYEVLEVLGRGGFGTVLKAFDERLHRVVAIKVLAPDLAASGSARQRFLREARTSASVRHEHVIDIHAVEEEPLPCLVMEYIDGQTLQQKLDRAGPLPVKEILRIGAQVAEGLAAAHRGRRHPADRGRLQPRRQAPGPGRPRHGRRCASWKGTRSRSGPWPSAPAARPSPRAARTPPSSCGTWPTAPTSAP
jgi:hypothetical protein